MSPVARTELWTAFINRPIADFDDTVALADRLGFDGLWCADSQNIMPEVWTLLSRAAVLSSRLKLGTYVTNPLTRQPVATASAAATLQDMSRGRVILGLGRGDSAHAYLGHGPMKLAAFSDYLDRLQAYLRGDAVPFSNEGIRQDSYNSLASLEYGEIPVSSRIEWLPSDQPKVPLDVAASGPKVTALAAAKADALSLAVGVDPQRIASAIAEARATCVQVGRDPDTLEISSLITVVVHPDRHVALGMAAGAAASIGRWQVMQGAGRGKVSDSQYAALDKARHAYDMTRHGSSLGSHASAMSPDMIDRFAIAGPPDYCIEKLRELMALGLARITLPHRSRGSDPEQQAIATKLLTQEVLPALQL